MEITATSFKARCLSLIDHVSQHREPITITKRGRVVARLVPAEDDSERPWERLRGTARWNGDPLAPVIDEDEIAALE